MELTLGAWFNEPKINFKFSHKVDLYIRKQIKENILEPLGLLDSYPAKFLHLNVTTEAERTELKVCIAPKWSQRTTNRTHGLWFPYRAIVNSDYPLREYLRYYMEALPVVFGEFGVTQKQLTIVKKNCEREILNNREYELSEEELAGLIDEESAIDEIIGDLGIESD